MNPILLSLIIIIIIIKILPVYTAHPSDRAVLALFCGHLLIGIAGSNSSAGIDASCVCCVLSCPGLCVGLIAHPEDSYRIWCFECDHEASIMSRPWPNRGFRAMEGGGSGEVNIHRLHRLLLLYNYIIII
jgi:hypothetical protein